MLWPISFCTLKVKPQLASHFCFIELLVESSCRHEYCRNNSELCSRQSSNVSCPIFCLAQGRLETCAQVCTFYCFLITSYESTAVKQGCCQSHCRILEQMLMYCGFCNICHRLIAATLVCMQFYTHLVYKDTAVTLGQCLLLQAFTEKCMWLPSQNFAIAFSFLYVWMSPAS